MSSRYTDIRAPGVPNSGFVMDGRQTRADMVARYRRRWQEKLDEAQAALAVPDEDLLVTTYVGLWSPRGKVEVVE